MKKKIKKIRYHWMFNPGTRIHSSKKGDKGYKRNKKWGDV